MGSMSDILAIFPRHTCSYISRVGSDRCAKKERLGDAAPFGDYTFHA
jgi:hypothetical protein